VCDAQIKPLALREDTYDVIIAREVMADDCYQLWDLKESGLEVTTAVDVGAHIGCATLLIKSLWSDARVLAFEPVENNAALFQENTCDLVGVELYRMAVVAALSGSVVTMVHADPPNTGGAHVVPGRGTPVQSMDIVRIISICGWQIDLLKLDCEGSEAAIVERLQKHSMLGRIACVVGELHDNAESEARGRIEEAFATTHELQFRPVARDEERDWELSLFTARRR
jgi:FkbM family methyltransferase